MAILRALPSLPETITLPSTFSVTSTIRAMKCALWAALSALSEVDALPFAPFRLPPVPEAVLGTILHKLNENAGKGLIPAVVEIQQRSDPDRVACARAFRGLVEASEVQLLLNPELRHYVPLERAVPTDVFSRRKALAISRATETRKRASAKTGPRGERRGGSEEWFESPTLHIRGKLDHWYLDEKDTLVIEDLKTGNADGALDQLQIYALLVLEKRGFKHAMLKVVGSGETDEIPFGPEDASAMKSRIAGAMKGLPAGQTKNLRDLASPGAQCGTCEYRPGCTAYHSFAAGKWSEVQTNDGEHLPFDTWGTVKEVTRTGEFSRIEITDAIGRRVHLERVQLNGHVLNSGQQVAAYELVPLRTHQGSPAHPTAFREIPTSLGGRRAFRAMLIFQKSDD